MSYTLGQTVYDIAISCTTNQVVIAEQEILCIGEKALFVNGKDPVWGSITESTLFYFSKDQFKPEQIFNTNTHSVWTDDFEKANHYASQIKKILRLKNNFSKTA